jgi:hypothetical protein
VPDVLRTTVRVGVAVALLATMPTLAGNTACMPEQNKMPYYYNCETAVAFARG